MCETKPCKACGVEKILAEYLKDPRLKDGHRNTCKACINKNRRNNEAKQTMRPNGVYATVGKILLRLRAGRADIESLVAVSSYYSVRQAVRLGYVRILMTKPQPGKAIKPTGLYEITELGLAKCPWRNPVARDRKISIPQQGANVHGPSTQTNHKGGSVLGAFSW